MQHCVVKLYSTRSCMVSNMSKACLIALISYSPVLSGGCLMFSVTPIDVQKLVQKRMEGDLEGDPVFFFRPLSFLIRLFLADLLESRLLTFGLRNILISSA